MLPFRFSSAPYVFTSIFRALQKSWRSQGIPIAIFLDDGIGGGTDFVSAKVNSLVVHSDLLKSGFVPNEESPFGSLASKPVARHFNLPYHSKQHMAVCGLSLHLGSSESRKTLEQKLIFQIGTLNPHGINERFSFN